MVLVLLLLVLVLLLLLLLSTPASAAGGEEGTAVAMACWKPVLLLGCCAFVRAEGAKQARQKEGQERRPPQRQQVRPKRESFQKNENGEFRVLFGPAC